MGETGDKGATKAVAVKQRQYVCVVGRRWLMSLRSAAGRRQATPLPPNGLSGRDLLAPRLPRPRQRPW